MPSQTLTLAELIPTLEFQKKYIEVDQIPFW